MYGMDPIVFLDEKNPLRRIAMHAIARHAHEQKKIMDNNLAVKIVNGVAALFSK